MPGRFIHFGKEALLQQGHVLCGGHSGILQPVIESWNPPDTKPEEVNTSEGSGSKWLKKCAGSSVGTIL